MPPARQVPIAEAMTPVAGWARALFGEPTTLEAFKTLQVPVLYMLGARSPASSREVGHLLTGALPDVRKVEFAELGHMGPVTHPEVVNAAIADFIASH